MKLDPVIPIKASMMATGATRWRRGAAAHEAGAENRRSKGRRICRGSDLGGDRYCSSDTAIGLENNLHNCNGLNTMDKWFLSVDLRARPWCCSSVSPVDD